MCDCVWERAGAGVCVCVLSTCPRECGQFMRDALNLSLTFAPAVGRAWDAITDPLVGYLVTRTNTRYGSLKPWILAAVVPATASYMALWMVPQGGKGASLLLMHCMVQLRDCLPAILSPWALGDHDVYSGRVGSIFLHFCLLPRLPGG